ncbi:MAG: YceI family protein [Pseudomonadota bacterium]
MRLPSFARSISRPLILSAILSSAALGQAVAAPYVMDKSHAHVTFMVDHLGFSTTHGKFRNFDAQIDFDPDAVEKTRLRFTIDAASVDTAWDARDTHLRSKDFFNVQKFPEIVFESTSVTPTGADTATVTGNLTIVGQTRPVSLDAKLNNMGPSPFDAAKTIAGFTVTGEIDRTEFGMTFAAPAVGTVIPIRIDLEISPAG